MRKILTTIALAITIAFAFSATANISLAETGENISVVTQKKVVLVCPISFEKWDDQGYSHPGGYQGMCSVYTNLPEDGKAEYKRLRHFDDTGFLPELPFRVWSPIFIMHDWTNGGVWYYRVEK